MRGFSGKPMVPPNLSKHVPYAAHKTHGAETSPLVGSGSRRCVIVPTPELMRTGAAATSR